MQCLNISLWNISITMLILIERLVKLLSRCNNSLQVFYYRVTCEAAGIVQGSVALLMITIQASTRLVHMSYLVLFIVSVTSILLLPFECSHMPSRARSVHVAFNICLLQLVGVQIGSYWFPATLVVFFELLILLCALNTVN